MTDKTATSKAMGTFILIIFHVLTLFFYANFEILNGKYTLEKTYIHFHKNRIHLGKITCVQCIDILNQTYIIFGGKCSVCIKTHNILTV